MKQRKLGDDELRGMLDDHDLWTRSGFQEGSRANFRECDLSGVDLSHRNLSGAVFYRANLRGAALTDTILFGTRLGEADLAGAILDDTVFRRVDLRRVRGLDKVVHRRASTVGVDTLLRSRGEIPVSFLEGTGVPSEGVDDLIEWAKRYGASTRFRSVFISYGGPDEGFARRLHDELLRQGVRTFFFPESAAIAEKLHRVMRKGINEYDRVILVCSEHSLDRPGVLNEIEETLQREAREGGAAILIPISLDDYVYTDWVPERTDIAQAIRDRVVADFRTARSNDKAFASSLKRLLSALEEE